jgi:hypothetical protein
MHILQNIIVTLLGIRRLLHAKQFPCGSKISLFGQVISYNIFFLNTQNGHFEEFILFDSLEVDVKCGCL